MKYIKKKTDINPFKLHETEITYFRILGVTIKRYATNLWLFFSYDGIGGV